MGLRLHERFAEVQAEIRTELAAAVAAAGHDVAEAAKANLYPGHGYDTGTLQASIHFEEDATDGGTLYVDAPYAGYVEFGTRRMAAIPYLTPALAEVPAILVARGKFRLRKGLQI